MQVQNPYRSQYRLPCVANRTEANLADTGKRPSVFGSATSPGKFIAGVFGQGSGTTDLGQNTYVVSVPSSFSARRIAAASDATPGTQNCAARCGLSRV